MKQFLFVPGWIKQPDDARDVPYTMRMEGKKLPVKMDLLAKMPPVFDQGNLGSCTANAGAAALYAVATPNKFAPVPSRLYLYYYIRDLIHQISNDSGGYIRDIFKAANRNGCASESVWPYDIYKFAVTPSSQAKTEAAQHPALKYEAVPQDINAAKDCLASGFPICFGMTLLSNFMKIGKNGKMPMPAGVELGGHATCIIGYDNRRKAFLVRNSWGADWGWNGNYWLPYSIFESTDYCDDFWTCKLVG